MKYLFRLEFQSSFFLSFNTGGNAGKIGDKHFNQCINITTALAISFIGGVRTLGGTVTLIVIGEARPIAATPLARTARLRYGNIYINYIYLQMHLLPYPENN